MLVEITELETKLKGTLRIHDRLLRDGAVSAVGTRAVSTDNIELASFCCICLDKIVIVLRTAYIKHGSQARWYKGLTQCELVRATICTNAVFKINALSRTELLILTA
jgi:hypothetical protein